MSSIVQEPRAEDADAGGAAGPPSRPAWRRAWEQTGLRHVAIALVAGLLLWMASLYFAQFGNLQLASMGYYFVAIAGLTVLVGINGQISIGHGALMAVGAYTAVKLQGEEGTGPPLVVVLLAAVAITTLVGVLVGAAAARLRGPYLAGATLALAVGLPAIAVRFGDQLGGENGLSVIPPTPPASLGVDFSLERWQAWICLLGALLTYFLLANVVRSRFGRTLRAVRDDEISAQLAGLSVARLQVLAFVLSAACAGLAGGLFVVVNSLAAPGAFTLTLSVALLTGVILGGLGSLMGAAWGAAAIVLLPTWSEDLSKALGLPGQVEANFPLLVYGAVLILVMLLFPLGLQGALRRLAGRVAGRSHVGRRPASDPPSNGAPAPEGDR